MSCYVSDPLLLSIAAEGIRTPTSCDIRTWSVRVYQFHHDGENACKCRPYPSLWRSIFFSLFSSLSLWLSLAVLSLSLVRILLSQLSLFSGKRSDRWLAGCLAYWRWKCRWTVPIVSLFPLFGERYPFGLHLGLEWVRAKSLFLSLEPVLNLSWSLLPVFPWYDDLYGKKNLFFHRIEELFCRAAKSSLFAMLACEPTSHTIIPLGSKYDDQNDAYQYPSSEAIGQEDNSCDDRDKRNQCIGYEVFSWNLSVDEFFWFSFGIDQRTQSPFAESTIFSVISAVPTALLEQSQFQIENQYDIADSSECPCLKYDDRPYDIDG